ncbi:MAG: hypothetical protein IPK19_09075 [Chloroflexi bacterium]|nr:hypothetical protein [Chloroflexota bacterium]
MNNRTTPRAALLRTAQHVTAALILLILVSGHPAQAAGVVGNGTPGSCTRTAIAAALTGGGLVTFNCGANPVSITIDQTLETSATSVTIDGGGLVTLQGAPGVRILRHFTWGFDAASTLTLRNLSFNGASISGSGTAANGAAVLSQNQAADFENDIPTLIVENVTFTSNTSTLTGGGTGYDFGGAAIYSLGGDVTIRDSTFTNNRALGGGAGGAVHILGSSLTIEDSAFTNNSAAPVSAASTNSGYGGALYVDGALFRGGGGITITGSTFTSNHAANQGGVAYINLYSSRGDFLTIDGSRFENNAISGGGMGLGGALSGGATADGGSNTVPITITNSLFSANQASGGPRGASGGAIAFAQPATVVIANSTFTGNRANGVCTDCWNANGGAIYMTNNPVAAQLINLTIANNYAGWVGGGVTIGGQGAILRNTVFANNTAENGGNGWMIQQHCSASHTNGGGNLQFPDRNPNPNFFNEVVCAAGITIANPLIGTSLSGQGTLIPAAGSPTIDQGTPATCAASPISNRDQRGAARPQDGDGNGSVVCDIGAHEVDSPLATLTGTIGLEGRAPGTPAMGVTLAVSLTGTTTSNHTPTTNNSGVFTLTNLTPGSYAVRVKHAQSLAEVQNIVLLSGNNPIDFGMLRTGDANNDNAVTIGDFSILAAAFGTLSPGVGYDARADFNGDNSVNIADFSLLATNFGQSGE